MTLTQEKVEAIKKELQCVEPEEQQERLQEILSTLTPEEREQLVGKQQCPFCLMAEGKIPTVKVYEDNDILAILDINPASPGHTLIFTKAHYALITELSSDEASKLFTTANKIAKAITKALNASGVNIYAASGPAAGQTAPHVLVNIIPRFENDGIRFGWQPKKLDSDALSEIGKKISENIEKEKPKVEVVELVEDDEEPIYG